MKSFLSIAAALFLAGVVAGCGGGGSPTTHTDSGVKDRPDMMKVVPHPDSGTVDGGDASNINTCGANGPALGLGDTCHCDAECGSNHCVEGVCCNSACTSGCQTCTAPDSPGTCLARAAKSAPRKASDCVPDSPASCGLNGFCDGAGACQNFLGNTCVGGTCNGDSVLGAFACDGAGACK
ncbi:MAG TPA: hypothetical protein VLA79_19935, partial [Polyangia bacterium]|nr:hypothetical protein [Polyangia bacterium]